MLDFLMPHWMAFTVICKTNIPKHPPTIIPECISEFQRADHAESSHAIYGGHTVLILGKLSSFTNYRRFRTDFDMKAANGRSSGPEDIISDFAFKNVKSKYSIKTYHISRCKQQIVTKCMRLSVYAL